MATIQFNPDAWASRVTGFPRIVQSILFDISLHNWRTGTSMSLAHYRIITSDLGEEQAMGIADMLHGAGKIAQDDHGIWSPDAIEDWRKADTLRQQRARGGSAPSPKAAKPKEPDAPLALPMVLPEPEAPAAPNEADELAAREAAEKAEADRLAKIARADGIRRISETWNIVASNCGLTTIRKLTDARRKAAGARLDEHGIDAMLDMIAAIPQSPFLLGENDRGWKLDYDAMCQASTCVKLIEGKYHNGGAGRASGWR